jgi:hypothetical protein
LRYAHFRTLPVRSASHIALSTAAITTCGRSVAKSRAIAELLEMAKKFFVGHEAAVGVLLPTAHPPRSSKAEKTVVLGVDLTEGAYQEGP